MGKCRYCGDPAGFLRRSHRTCRDTHARGIVAIAGTMADATLTDGEAAEHIRKTAEQHLIHGKDLLRAVHNGWTTCVQGHLVRDGVDPTEEKRLDALLARFDTDRVKADRRQIWEQVEQARREKAEQNIRRLLHEAMKVPQDLKNEGEDATRQALAQVEDKIASAATEGGITKTETRAMIVKAMEGAIDRALDDDFLSSEEEDALVRLTSHFRLDKDHLDIRGTWTRVVKAAVLRDLMEGKVPERMQFGGHPFRLQKSETLIWAFENVDYSTVRTRTEFRGGYAGVSIRIAKGLYFRTGGFKGHPVQHEETVHVDTGLLGVTTRHLYFSGSSKSFRIRHSKIVTLEAYSDGVGVMREGVRAKPEFFEVGDGWFAYNLLHNIEVP